MRVRVCVRVSEGGRELVVVDSNRPSKSLLSQLVNCALFFFFLFFFVCVPFLFCDSS